MVEKGVDMMIGVDILKNAYEDLCDTANTCKWGWRFLSCPSSC